MSENPRFRARFDRRLVRVRDKAPLADCPHRLAQKLASGTRAPSRPVER